VHLEVFMGTRTLLLPEAFVLLGLWRLGLGFSGRRLLVLSLLLLV